MNKASFDILLDSFFFHRRLRIDTIKSYEKAIQKL